MENINTTQHTIAAATAAHGNLTQPLQSSIFVPMDSVKDKSPATGNRYCKLIKKGENSKLGQSLAVEIPCVSGLAVYLAHQGLQEYFTEAMQALQDNYIKSRAIAGAAQIQYSELSADNLAEFASLQAVTGGLGHMSEERIKNWFESSARELLLVALAERLGIADTATESDIKKLEQIANQTRDNLAKLSSKKPVQFDVRVTNALNWALDVTDSGDSLTSRMRTKLNMVSEETVNMADALGF